MAQVIALDEYRNRRKELTRPVEEPPERPVFRADDVWGRNYTELEAIVFGLLKVREALRYYTLYDRDMEELFLGVLDAAYHLGRQREGEEPEQDDGLIRLKAAVLPLKEYILENMTEDAVKPMKTALIILDLIEKSPLYR
jgi:hypothetical protein